MSWRASDELLDRVRRQAAGRGKSLNEWVTLVLEAASDPSYASSEADRLRERLAAAGLLERPATSSGRRPSRQAIAKARAEAGRGTQLSDLVTSDRR